MQALSIADRVILATLSPVGDMPGTLRASLGTGERLDWQCVVERAEKLHVCAPVYRALSRLVESAPPVPQDERGSVAAALQAVRRQCISRAMETALLCEQLEEILRATESACIPVALLKGAHLVATVYQDRPEERSMSDIDLLVRPEDLDRLEATLHSLGYSPVHPSPERWREQHFHLCPLVHPRHRLSIEVHWALTRPTCRIQLDTAGLWAAADEIRFRGLTVRGLSPTDNLVFLTVHAFFIDKLRANGLRQVRDISALLCGEANRIEWPRVIERARALDVTRHLCLALTLARSITGATVPANVLRELEASGLDDGVIEEGYRRLFWSASAPQYPPRIVSAWESGGLGGIVNGIKDWASLEALERTYGRQTFSWLLYLRLPHRIFSWLRRRGPSLWLTLIRDRDLQVRLNRVAALDTWLD